MVVVGGCGVVDTVIVVGTVIGAIVDVGTIEVVVPTVELVGIVSGTFAKVPLPSPHENGTSMGSTSNSHRLRLIITALYHLGRSRKF